MKTDKPSTYQTVNESVNGLDFGEVTFGISPFMVKDRYGKTGAAKEEALQGHTSEMELNFCRYGPMVTRNVLIRRVTNDF